MKRITSPTELSSRLGALSEPVRLRIMRVLEREELSVGEIGKVVQLPQSTVSRHLKVLADDGWLGKRTEGTATLYRLVLDDLDREGRMVWLAVREALGAEPDEDSRRLAGVLAERRTDSQTFFGKMAGQWDDVRGELFGSRFTLHAMLSLLPAHWVVADLGCGTGNVSELLAPVVSSVIAVDRSEPMLKAARKRLSGFSNVTFVDGELGALPLADASVDAAVCVLVLHHLEAPEAALSEMARIVKPGGVALVVDMLEHARATYRQTMGHRWLGFSEAGIKAMAEEAGLTGARIVSLPADPDGKGPGLFACTAFGAGGKGR